MGEGVGEQIMNFTKKKRKLKNGNPPSREEEGKDKSANKKPKEQDSGSERP